MSKVSTLLREARIKANLSQFDLASRLGYSSAQFISNIERGKASLPPKHFGTISRLLKFNVRAIIDAKQEDLNQRLRSAVKNGNKKK